MLENGKKVYSISKLNTLDNCEHEAFLRYVRKEEGKDGVYGILGTRVHDTLEEIMEGYSGTDALIPALDSEFENLAILDLDFPRDFRGGTSIRDNWVRDMTHFCSHFTKPKGKFNTEEFFLYQLDDDHFLQGYIDLIRHNDDGSISIIDWKTSSNFSASDLTHHGRQLVLYAIAKEQEGFNVRDVMWYMLKYVEVRYMGFARKNARSETEIVKVVNRGKLVRELTSVIQSKLGQAGFSEIDIEIMMEDIRRADSLESLPDNIKSQFQIRPYVRKYALTEETRSETLKYISCIIKKFESMGCDENDWKCKSFVNDKGREDTFYCNVLCSYRHICKHIKKHNDLRQLLNKKDEDLF